METYLQLPKHSKLKFSERFKNYIEVFGIDCAYEVLVDTGNMQPWEFRFWSGFRSLT